jgi:hypothetical protein
MSRPTDLYRSGYEKGAADNLAGHVGEAIFGLLRDDPGDHFSRGYQDGAAGRRFNPPSDAKNVDGRRSHDWTRFWD